MKSPNLSKLRNDQTLPVINFLDPDSSMLICFHTLCYIMILSLFQVAMEHHCLSWTSLFFIGISSFSSISAIFHSNPQQKSPVTLHLFPSPSFFWLLTPFLNHLRPRVQADDHHGQDLLDVERRQGDLPWRIRLAICRQLLGCVEEMGDGTEAVGTAARGYHDI